MNTRYVKARDLRLAERVLVGPGNLTASIVKLELGFDKSVHYEYVWTIGDAPFRDAGNADTDALVEVVDTRVAS